MICEKCYRPIAIGDFPFCPHGATRVQINGDEWRGGGGRWIENLDHQPVYCETKSAWKREMEKRHLRPTDRHMPGDRYGSIALMDPQTLANGTALVERAGTATDAPVTLETLETYIGEPR